MFANFIKTHKSVLIVDANFNLLRDKDLHVKINENVPKLNHFYQICVKNDTQQIKEILAKKPYLISYEIPLAKFKTVFHFAALNNNMELFEHLFKLEPNGIHFGDNHNLTPLFYVSDTNNLEFFKRLLELGADINHIDKKGSTILYRSVALSKTSTFEFILKNNVNVNVQSELGRTPLIKSSNIISIFVQTEENKTVTRTS